MKRGSHHRDATRAKMSAASKAAWSDPAVRAKMSAARKAAEEARAAAIERRYQAALAQIRRRRAS